MHYNKDRFDWGSVEKGWIDSSNSALPNMSESRAMAKDMPDFKNDLSEIETTMN